MSPSILKLNFCFIIYKIKNIIKKHYEILILITLHNSNLGGIGKIYQCSGTGNEVEPNGVINEIEVPAGTYLIIAKDTKTSNGMGGIYFYNQIFIGFQYYTFSSDAIIKYINTNIGKELYYNDGRYWNLMAIKLK